MQKARIARLIIYEGEIGHLREQLGRSFPDGLIIRNPNVKIHVMTIGGSGLEPFIDDELAKMPGENDEQ